MAQKPLLFSLGLTLLLTASVLAQSNQSEDAFTIVTYYPSPHGMYNQLGIYRSVKFQPVNITADLPGGYPPEEGELVLNGPDNKFYYRSGGTWVPQAGGGGGVCYTVFGINTCANGYQAVVSGYTKAYIVYGSYYAAGNIVCSPTKSTSVSGNYFLSQTADGRADSMNNETCAICCK